MLPPHPKLRRTSVSTHHTWEFTGVKRPVLLPRVIRKMITLLSAEWFPVLCWVLFFLEISRFGTLTPRSKISVFWLRCTLYRGSGGGSFTHFLTSRHQKTSYLLGWWVFDRSLWGSFFPSKTLSHLSRQRTGKLLGWAATGHHTQWLFWRMRPALSAGGIRKIIGCPVVEKQLVFGRALFSKFSSFWILPPHPASTHQVKRP